MSCCSYVVMPSDRVRELCEKALERAKSRRDARKLEAIAERRTEIEGSFFRRLFGLRIQTDDEIRDDLEHRRTTGGYPGPFFWADYQYGCARDAVEPLLRAATVADTVSVSTEAIGWIA